MDIEQFKSTLPTIESSVPNLKRKTATESAGSCPKCGGQDRFVINDGKFLCRNCHPKFGDVIEFHAWMEGLSSGEFIKQRMSTSPSSRKQKTITNKQGSEKLQGVWDRIKQGIEDLSPVYNYLCNIRKISRSTVEKAAQEGKIKSWHYPLSVSILNQCYNDGTDPHAVAFRLDRLDNGTLTAIESISTTGKPLFVGPGGTQKKKKFEKGSKASEGFFAAGAPISDGGTICLVEAALNALSGEDCVPGASWLALGSSTMTAKLKQLKDILKGRKSKIVCFFDNDSAGEKAVRQSAKTLGRKIFTVVYPDGTKRGFDVNDFLKAGQRETVVEMVEYSVAVEVEEKKGDSKTQSEILLEIAADYQLFHSPEGGHYARIKREGHIETWPVRSEGFKRTLRYQFFTLEGKTPSAQALSDALGVIEAIAEFDGLEHQVYTRVAMVGEKVFVDLANPDWEIVEISKDGWRIVNESDAYFIRPAGMLPLQRPATPGDISKLRPFLNLREGAEGEMNWRLTVGWLIKCFIPQGADPILGLSGPQGCAKSTETRILKTLTDPNVVHLRGMPKNPEDLVVAARHNYLLPFDNASGIQNWLSDLLCCVSTGAGFGTRKLYSNMEEEQYSFKRPIVLNGINDVIHRHDLADRTIAKTLPTIPEEKRMLESNFMAEFTKIIADVLGGIFNAVSHALRNRHKIKPKRLPRMADFALWVMAAEAGNAFPWKPGGFMEAYNQNRASIIETALESDLVGGAVKKLIENSISDEWTGTASELLDALEQIVSERTLKNKFWPKSANSLSRHINRSSGFLGHVGIKITGGKSDGKRFISLQRIRDDIRDDIDDTLQISSKVSSLNNVSGLSGLDDRDGLDDKIPTSSVELEEKERKRGIEVKEKGVNVKGRKNTVQTVQTVHGHFDDADDCEFEEVIL